MSSLYTNGPAWRLSRSACQHRQTLGVIAPARVGFCLSYQTVGRRQYATKRLNPNAARTANPPPPKPTTPPSRSAPSRAPRLFGKGTGVESREPARLIFSSQDVPPLQEWIKGLENLGNRDLTPLQCVDGASRYVSIATQYESQWRPKLENEHHLSPFMLHWLGILLISGNTAARWRLGTHMLRSASELGYMASTLSLVRIFSSMPSQMFGKVANSIMYRDANARFQEAVKDGTDPNALTLQGIIHAKGGDRRSDMEALAVFARATQAWEKTKRKNGAMGDEIVPKAFGSGEQAPTAKSTRVTNSEAIDEATSRDFTLPPPREPRWEWEVSCILGQANILAKDPSTTKEAVKFFRVAALELDNPRGFLMLAKLMTGPHDGPERQTYLLKAAISGEIEACPGLGELEALAAARTDLSRQERAAHDMLSKQWFRLADGKDLSAIIKAENVSNQGLDK